jgi:AraC-like DNA-binding protein
MDGLLRWMRYSIIILSCFALIVPLLIYMPNGGLPLFGLFFFASIFYLVDSFCSYVVSSAPRKVAEAEVCEETMQLCEDRSMSPDGDLTELTPDVVTRINRSVERWTSTGGHLHAGMKMPQTAKELGLPQYQLSAWLRQNGLKYADWMTDLRIDEAKRLLESHHDWSNEAIAAHCGFSDRSYFQRKFKETIGISPTEYLMHVASN